MEPSQRTVASPQVPADETVNQPVGQPSIHQATGQSQTLGLQHPWGDYLQPEFQDSNMSPALHLLPENTGAEHNFTEYSLFQQSDNEFAPLRGFPDMSMASERFHGPPQDRTCEHPDRGSLSQHLLAQTTLPSEGSSFCSLSQHSLSPGDEGRPRETSAHSPLTPTTDRQKVAPRDQVEKDSRNPVKLSDESTGEDAVDETFFLSKNIPVGHLIKLLQEDVGMPSSSSSAVSLNSETSGKSTLSLMESSKSSSKPDIDPSTVRREGPPGEASLPQQKTQQSDRDFDRSRTRLSEVCNITTGSRSTKPDDSSEELQRELLLEVEKRKSIQAEAKRRQKSPTPTSEPSTPYPTGAPEGNPSVARAHQGGVPWTGQFSAGVVRGLRGQNIWNQAGIEGSYLGFLPQSQSTPGVSKAPPKSSVKAKLGELSAIESNKENSSNQTGISPEPVVPVHHPNTSARSQDEARVHSLPILNYMEKVDAWRANQSSTKTSLFESLALQGFSGVSPKKKAYQAVSEPLNRMLSQQAGRPPQQTVSNPADQSETQKSSTFPPGSTLERGEAVGSAPNDKDSTLPATTRPSSVSTTVTSVQGVQLTEKRVEKQSQTRVSIQPVLPSSLVGLGQFSDISLDEIVTLSSSGNSNNSGVKLGASVGASSVVSLEVDNYAPYWTEKHTTPPSVQRPPELNIDERIPLYLQNLGINQSPSTILKPFAPRGPIREAELSPPDLCTIKESIGTPTKSTKPAEAGTPHKADFSRYSVLSVDSSVSLPFSVDSLAPAAPIPGERPRRASPPSSVTQSIHRLTSSFIPDENSYPSTQQSTIQRDREGSVTSSQSTVHSGDRENDSPMIVNRSAGQNADTSFASSKALMEIRNMLAQADYMVSSGSSQSSNAAPPPLLSDKDIFLRKKSSSFQDSLFSSSSSSADPGTKPSLPWARSSSDSMLTSERVRESSIGREGTASPRQPSSNQTTQALIPAPGKPAHRPQQDSIVDPAVGSFVITQSARRAEPEGCSAAPPDNAVTPQQPTVTNPSQPVTVNPSAFTNPSPSFTSTQKLTPTPTDDSAGESDEEEEEQTILEDPPQLSSSASLLQEDSDQGVMSDGSSQSSLALRVAKILQGESPATMVSSTASLMDQEESKAREWIKLKVSGQQCEHLELDKEDRKRIEEIKRELLLRNPLKSQVSTDTESSAASSLRIPIALELIQRSNKFTTVNNANSQTSPQPPQSLGTNPPNPNAQLQKPPYLELEAQIHEIAAREGITLPRKNLQPLTSITIATRRRSTSPSPSTSPAPPVSPAPGVLHLNELSTEAKADQQTPLSMDDGDKTTSGQALCEPNGNLQSRNQNLTSQKRQDAVGGQFEEPAPPSQRLGIDTVHPKEYNSQAVRQKDVLSVNDSSVSGVVHEEEKGPNSSSTSASPASSAGHVSHVHLTLSPKTAAVKSGHADVSTQLTNREFVSLRHSPSSPDEGVGLSSPPEWNDNGEQARQRGTDRGDTAAIFKTPAVTQGKMATQSTSTQSFTPRDRGVVSPRTATFKIPAGPISLVPYKPHGCQELFYVPQAEADFSSTDTTMESTHTGSDDAVPPRFSSDVLGHQDPGLDRGVALRHTEGIYSKRLKTTTFRMSDQHKGASASTNDTSQVIHVSSAPHTAAHVSVAFTRVSSPHDHKASKRDQGTSPVPSLTHDRSVPKNKARDQPKQITIPENRGRRDSGPSAAPPGRSTLDQLWERFCEEWSVDESTPDTHRDRDMTLLERLERLSRIIHSTRDNNRANRTQEERMQTRDHSRKEASPSKHSEKKVRRSRHVDESRRESVASSVSPRSSVYPAERDDSSSSPSTCSMSTIDTDRLVRAFGAHRVHSLKANSSLGRLYITIDRQRGGQRRSEAPHRVVTMSQSTGTDESTVSADSTSSSSTYNVPPHSGQAGNAAAKKYVKLVNKGIQAGNLEFVRNATRRHTRDVGTTFPSPGSDSLPSRRSSPRASAERGAPRGSSRSQTHRQRRSKKSPPETYPEGVSWFISADSLRSEARKENRLEEGEEPGRPGVSWFEPCQKVPLWREPFRQRQVQEEEQLQSTSIHPTEPQPDPEPKTISSGLARLSLQEALQMHRPEFISVSRQRVKRLALQVEDRKQQDMFSRERELYGRLEGGYGRMTRPAGTALPQRAVPRKEMIQRSKQIYENLPEVQRRKEEERRKAEYRSYRLNAQLYNKRITSHVLGRRPAWH